jgi:hypothetical protein
MNAAPGPGSELPKSSDAMPDAVRRRLTEVTRALAQVRTALMLIPEQWRPCDDAFILELARVRNRSANERPMTDDEKGIIDPVEYPIVLADRDYKLADDAVELIKPIEQELYECRCGVEDAFKEIGYALYLERFWATTSTKSQKKAAEQFASALRRIEIALPELFNDPDFPVRGFPKAELLKWRPILEEIGDSRSRKRPQMNALKKRLAVAEAHQLLQKYGSRRVTATKNGEFCRLAALLYGDPKADLINQCKAYIRVPTPTATDHIEQTRIERNAEGEKSGTK